MLIQAFISLCQINTFELKEKFVLRRFQFHDDLKFIKKILRISQFIISNTNLKLHITKCETRITWVLKQFAKIKRKLRNRTRKKKHLIYMMIHFYYFLQFQLSKEPNAVTWKCPHMNNFISFFNQSFLYLDWTIVATEHTST